MKWKAWFLATRPKTLSAAVVPVIMAASLAARHPLGIDWSTLAFALAGAVLIQVATNFVNDALDFKKGADTHERLGPLRVTQAGLLSADTVLEAAVVAVFLAAMCGIPLILRGGWPLLVIGLASIVAAWAYTGGPYPLAYHGLGEMFVVIFFGFVAVGGTYYVLTLSFDESVLLAGLAAGSLATILLVINNLRDIDTDRGSRKRTMAVRFGSRFARAEMSVFTIAPFVASSLIAFSERSAWLLLPLAAIPLAAILLRRVMRSSGAELNRSLALAGALQWAFGVLFVIGALVR